MNRARRLALRFTFRSADERTRIYVTYHWSILHAAFRYRAGCSSTSFADRVHARSAPSRPTVATVAAPIPAPVAAKPLDTSFKVSEAVRVKCNLPDTPTDSPQFDFDQADLRPRGMGILDDIATCLQKGSMKGEGVIVTGHTDPRGSDSYNEDLGMRRANTARDYLVSKGIASADITVTSRGKLDATGDDAAGWQLDRRIAIDERSAIAAQ
jgi:outer membrane protein OmpA-like peptidoglycan-associated protein